MSNPTSQSILEEGLLNWSFQLIDRNYSNVLRADGQTSYTRLLKNDKQLANILSKSGAEIVIVSNSEIRHAAFNQFGQKLYYVSAVLTVRAIWVSTAQVLSSFQKIGKGIGISEELARVKAIKQVGPKSIESLLKSFIHVWRNQEKYGRKYYIQLLKCKGYRKARRFIHRLKSLKGVKSVKELKYFSGRLELEVQFRGSKQSLVDGIFEYITKLKGATGLRRIVGMAFCGATQPLLLETLISIPATPLRIIQIQPPIM